MSRRTRSCVLLALVAALLCANVGFVSAARAETGPRNTTDSSRVALRVDTTAGRAFVSLVEPRSDRSSGRTPAPFGLPVATANAARLQALRTVTEATEHAQASPGGPAIGSRAPPSNAA